MHARVTTFKARLDKTDEGIQFFESTASTLREMRGFTSGYFLIDRANGDAMTVTLWDSEEAIQASKEALGGIWAQAADLELMDGPPSPRIYEVGAQAEAALDTTMTD